MRGRPQKAAAAEHLHLACSRRSLRKNNFFDKGWTALFKALCENKGDKIESWDLSNERVGPETAKALADYITISPALNSVRCDRLPCQCVMAPMNMHFSSARSLADNRLCGLWNQNGLQQGTYTPEGIIALCEGLKGSAVTSLE